jgi:hypothetical protein
MINLTSKFSKIAALILIGGWSLSIKAQNVYTLLEPEITGASTTAPTDFLAYINLFYKVLLWLTIALAIVYIVIGGIQYMTAAAASGKGDGKKKIGNALIGLVIALLSYLVLFSINPDLVEWRICIPQLPDTKCDTK